jgi:hypothetical protein
MKRRDFLRRFGIGAAAVVAAPFLVKAALPGPIPPPTGEIGVPADQYHLDKCKEVYQDHIRQYPLTPTECYSSPTYTSQWDELAAREAMRPHYPELVKRYDNVSIVDMLKITRP